MGAASEQLVFGAFHVRTTASVEAQEPTVSVEESKKRRIEENWLLCLMLRVRAGGPRYARQRCVADENANTF